MEQIQQNPIQTETGDNKQLKKKREVGIGTR